MTLSTQVLRRLADKEKKRDWLDGLSQKQLAAVLADFDQKSSSADSGKRGKGVRRTYAYTMLEVHDTLAAVSGEKHVADMKKMWVEEYVEFCRSVQGGYQTREEAMTSWRQLMDDPSVPRDHKGPKGSLRMNIKIADLTQSFDQVSQQRAATGVQQSLKKVTDAQASAIVKDVVGDFDESSLFGRGLFNELKVGIQDGRALAGNEAAGHAFASNSYGASLLNITELEMVANSAVKPSAKKKARTSNNASLNATSAAEDDDNLAMVAVDGPANADPATVSGSAPVAAAVGTAAGSAPADPSSTDQDGPNDKVS